MRGTRARLRWRITDLGGAPAMSGVAIANDSVTQMGEAPTVV